MGTTTDNKGLIESGREAANGHSPLTAPDFAPAYPQEAQNGHSAAPELPAESPNGAGAQQQSGRRNGRADKSGPPLGAPRAGGKEPEPDQRRKVIKFSKVSKRFVLHQERPRSFQEMLTGLLGKGRALKVAPPELRAENADFWALRDVNFSIYEGEALGIIGENGSGKSTTLKLISRILYPTDGSVTVRGKVSALLELGTGFHTDLTGRENIYLNGSLLGISRRDMDERYKEIVDFSELERFIDTPIKHWSSGMVMRLGFAVAINVDPDILITDEVLAVGDEAFQRKCMEQIARFRRAGKTIIFVSHALEAVRSLCSRAIWLEHGVVRADGPTATVIDQYLEYANQRHRERLHAEYVAGHSSQAPLGHEADEALAHEGAAGDAAPLDPSQPGSRWGTGAATISGVTFLDAAGQPSNVFTTGDKMTIRIFYNAPQRIERPVFGLAIYAESGQHLTGPNNRFGGYDIPFIQGDDHVDYTIDSLPLLAGEYDVTVALTGADMTEMYDHQHRWYNFVVQPNPALPDRFGTIYIPGHWSQESH